MSLRQVDSFIDTLKTIVSLDGMSNLTRKTFNVMTNFNGWMRRVARISKEGCAKRLNKRHYQKHPSRRIVRTRLDKCGCKKCKRRVNKKTIEPDLLANMAYELRVPQENPFKVDEIVEKISEEPKIIKEIIEKSPKHALHHRHHHQHHQPHQPHQHQPRVHHVGHQDSRYLQQSDCVGLAWWTEMNHRVYMPPLIQTLSLKPTRSECSSISGFRTGSPMISDHIPSRGYTPNSEYSDYKSCKDDISSRYHSTSKSDAKIPLNSTIREKKPVGRSASMPLGQKPRELQGLQMAAKRKLEKKRPVRSTSHTTDNFTNCVKCSRIVSMGFKKMTC